MKNALKNILTSVLFVFGFFVLLFVLSKLFVPKNNTEKEGIPHGDELAYGFLAEKENSIDTIILGNSYVYSSIIPIQFWKDYGFTSYCISTIDQDLGYAEYLFKKVMSRQTPKVVIFETDNFFQRYYLGDIASYKSWEIFPIIAYHDRWKSLVLKDLKIFNDPEYENIIDSKGYLFSTLVNPAGDKKEGFGIDESKFFFTDIDLMKRQAVKNMINLCKEKGSKVVFMNMPYLYNYSPKRLKRSEEFAKELGADYVDLNKFKDELNIDWNSESRDGGVHLNYYGAMKVTKWVGKYLYELNVLTDHSKDQDYSSWDASYEVFQKRVEAAEKADKK